MRFYGTYDSWFLIDPGCVNIRDAIFRKLTNRNQTNTNEIATTETKYQTDFLFFRENTNI